MTRLGLIGLGRWGRNYIRTIESIPDATIVSASRLSPDATDYGFPVYQDWREVLNDGVDGVIVSAHPSIHLEVARACSSLGIPVMLEKPMALSLHDATLISEFRVPILVNHIHLFAPAFVKLREAYLSAGSPYINVISCGCGPGPNRDYSSAWDYGPHDLSMCFSLSPPSGLPTAERFSCTSGDTFRIRIPLVSGSADVTVGNVSPSKIRLFRAEFDGHVFVYDAMSSSILTIDGRAIDVQGPLPLTSAVVAFLQTIRSGETDWRFGTSVGLDVVRTLSGLP